MLQLFSDFTLSVYENNQKYQNLTNLIIEDDTGSEFNYETIKNITLSLVSGSDKVVLGSPQYRNNTSPRSLTALYAKINFDYEIQTTHQIIVRISIPGRSSVDKTITINVLNSQDLETLTTGVHVGTLVTALYPSSNYSITENSPANSSLGQLIYKGAEQNQELYSPSSATYPITKINNVTLDSKNYFQAIDTRYDDPNFSPEYSFIISNDFKIIPNGILPSIKLKTINNDYTFFRLSDSSSQIRVHMDCYYPYGAESLGSYIYSTDWIDYSEHSKLFTEYLPLKYTYNYAAGYTYNLGFRSFGTTATSFSLSHVSIYISYRLKNPENTTKTLQFKSLLHLINKNNTTNYYTSNLTNNIDAITFPGMSSIKDEDNTTLSNLYNPQTKQSRFLINETDYLTYGLDFDIKYYVQPDGSKFQLAQIGNYTDFNIEPILTRLRTSRSFDYETEPTKIITINVLNNSDQIINSSPLTISVNDAIDGPSNIFLNTSSIIENAEINTEIGTLSVTDTSNTSIIYSVISGSSNFNISGNKLRSSVPFNYESSSTQSVTIRATNGLSGYFDKTFTINVINAAPTSISLSSVTISENASNQATVATINASDPAGGTCTFTFDTGVGSEDNNSFQIVGSLLKLAANVTLNYELKNTYSIKIKATDPGGLSYSETFTINVTNTNEAPYNLELSSNSILENSPVNTIIGLLSASDVDQNDSLIFSVLVGTSNFNISGNQLRSSVVFDYENTTSQSVTIRATDSGGLYVDKQFTINVLNVNEAPTSITISSSSILENNAIGDVIGTLSATDPENNSVTFSLDTVNDYASFSITGNQLKAATVFNRELKNLYTIRVIATDTNNNTFAQTLNISIGNRVEPPLNISLSSTQILENNLTDAIIGTLSAIDPEGGTISFSVVDGADKFNVVSVGGIWKLRASVSFDYATQAQHSVTVRATNANSEYADKTFSIEILEYIEPETVNLTNQQYTLADSGKAYVETIYDPTVVGLLIDGAALVPGSVVINSNSGQKYLKLTGNMTDYYVIPLNAKPEWVWSTSGYAIWQII